MNQRFPAEEEITFFLPDNWAGRRMWGLFLPAWRFHTFRRCSQSCGGGARGGASGGGARGQGRGHGGGARGSSCRGLVSVMPFTVLGDRNSVIRSPGRLLVAACSHRSHCPAPLGLVSGFSRSNRSQRNAVTLLDDNARLRATDQEGNNIGSRIFPSTLHLLPLPNSLFSG